MRIAVVGAGISGLASAYFLARQHKVKLFERNDYFGGHSNTVSTNGPDGELHLDTGFVVYNEGAYPRFSRLLKELNVHTQQSDMSFSVTCRVCDLEYSSRGVSGLLASGTRVLRPRNARFLFDLWRFFHDSNQVDEGSLDRMTLPEYTAAHGFGTDFSRHFLVPLASAVWSTPPGGIEGFPAEFFIRFLRNHGLLGSDDRWRWRTITGGSRVYVNAIVEHLGNGVFSETPVREVRRCGDGARVCLGNGEQQDFDAVVLACHANEAADLIQDATPEEEEALACFTYTRNRVVLHADSSLLPSRPSVRASWNYVTEDCHAQAPLSVTYHLNRLQSLDSETDYCVTVNPPPGLHPELVLRELDYSHPTYTFRTLEGQRRLAAINGKDRIYYAGAHLGYGFHEDGVASAAQVATMLGVNDA
jgi:predicted NAD/FAD-binding protein